MKNGPLAPYEDTIPYGSRTIHFHVVRSDRKTLGIQVHPDGSVEVRAPLGASQVAIRSRIERRARWITRQQRAFTSIVQAVSEKEYIAGETHLYLGGQYRLLIYPSTHNEVKLRGRYFEVYTTQPQKAEQTHRLLDGWYRDAAHRHLACRFALGVHRMQRYGVGSPELVMRVMKKRWGSCTPSRRIVLNPWLILAPTFAIDYVVIHELCHLVHPHHAAPFYRLLSRVLPDWRMRKARLAHVHF